MLLKTDSKCTENVVWLKCISKQTNLMWQNGPFQMLLFETNAKRPTKRARCQAKRHYSNDIIVDQINIRGKTPVLEK